MSTKRFLVQCDDANTGKPLVRAEGYDDEQRARIRAREMFSALKAHADVTDTTTGRQVFHTAADPLDR